MEQNKLLLAKKLTEEASKQIIFWNKVSIVILGLFILGMIILY